MTDNFRTYTYTVMPEDHGRTVQWFMRNRLHFSAHMIARCKFGGRICVNGGPVHTDRIVSAGDLLKVSLPEDSEKWERLIKCDLRPDIVFEDEDLIVVNKPAPLPSLSSGRQHEPTLEDCIYTYFGCPERFVYRPVNRLDKGTSGLIVIAKNAFVQGQMQSQLHSSYFERTYAALLDGVLPDREGQVDAPVAKQSENSVKRVVSAGGKKAVTEYAVLSQTQQHSLVRLRLFTGRTHQIRVHMAFLGCPVTGDYLYGRPHPDLEGRFALHSRAVTFCHPVSRKMLYFEAPTPEVFTRILEKDGQ